MTLKALILFFILPPLAAIAQAPRPKPAVDSSASSTRVGSIRGRVLCEGRAVNSASVMLTRVNSTSASRFVPTDDNGDFEAKNLEEGVYRISATAPGYAKQLDGPETYYRLGETATVTMLRGAVITGRVTGTSDEPVVAVRVRANMIRDSNGNPRNALDPNTDRITDDRGFYRIFGLRPGMYVVSAGGQGSRGFGINGYDHDA